MSGGHFPPYNHLQSPQEFLGPRHRLPGIPSPGPSAPYTSVPPSHAHTSTPPWLNKQSYPSNYHDSASYYPASRNYAPVSRAPWQNPSSENSSAPRCVNPNKESRLCTNVFSSDVQQESMDLSSSSHVVPPKSESPAKPSLNGEVPNEQINGTKCDSDSEKASKEVSVIAPNPLKSAFLEDDGNDVKSNTDSRNDVAKSTVPSDNVESALETLFQSDDKSPIAVAAPSVIVSAQCKKSDLRAESVENILKSPSPRECDPSPEAMLEALEKSEEIEPNTKATKKLYSDPSVHVIAQNLSSCDRIGSEGSLRHDSDTLPEKPTQTEISDIVTKTNVNAKKTNVKRSAQHSKEDECSNTNKAENANSVSRHKADGAAKSNSLKSGGKNANKVDSKNDEITYVEVESELEKMFAGIEDNGSRDADVDPLNTLPSDSSADPCHSSQQITSNSTDNVPTSKANKKKSSKKSKSNNTSLKTTKTKLRDSSSADYGTRRVPVIHVEGSKENPISVQIINSIKVEEDDLSDSKIAAKRKLGKHDRAAKKLAASYVLKNYDPGTSDASWVCVFCNLCPHNPAISGEPIGDLFGPYFISPKHSSADNDQQRHSRRTDHFDQVKKKKSKKQKRSLSTDSNFTDTPSTEQKPREVWAHENCFVWASGVHLIGSKIMGFEEAVWEALETTCAHCGDKGASIGCRARHCKSVVHYGCAVFTGWSLDPESFITTCSIHTVRVPD